jgi:predicted GNAT superfamily acetyltransferase
MQMTTSGISTSVTIQTMTDLEHLGEAVALQRTIWGYSDLDADSRALLVVASRFAGQVIGAFDQGRLIGFGLAFSAIANGEIRLHSHRVGILPEYQNLGVGRLLKLAQREDALAREIRTIQWTFDPLQQRNAYFNIERLGGISRRYIPNLYGVTSSPLHGGLPTDRLLIEWELESPRVLQVLNGNRPSRTGSVIRIAVPDFTNHKDAAAQQRLKDTFLELFASGHVVTGFEKTADGANFLLEKE